MQRSTLKACSVSQSVQGNVKCMCSKHVALGNELVKVCFFTNSFEIHFGVRLFKSLHARNC